MESRRAPAVGSLPPSVILWILGVVQCTGLLSALLARASEGSQRQGRYQWFFLGCLAMSGLATIASLQLNAGGWFLSGISVCLMVLGATCEFRYHEPTTVY
ncbi:MAG: hypothetical protein A2W31_09145 [Planctomycetes bacterium RBG_16_64_10]|nr:MAG: hypothetical protein A2W31_09145 [Planctomycetes bacterium RBG_16_64_10]